MTVPPHDAAAPSAWVRRFVPALARPGGRVLDLACGSGRHLRWLAAAGFEVTGVDREAAALDRLRAAVPGAELVVADLEGAPWPLAGRCFDAVVVTNYLWRPLWPAILGALDPDGGVLVCETFADGQQHIGRPSRPEFLLRPGELLAVCAALTIVAYEDGCDPQPETRCVQRIAAVAESGVPAPPRRHRLAGRRG